MITITETISLQIPQKEIENFLLQRGIALGEKKISEIIYNSTGESFTVVLSSEFHEPTSLSLEQRQMLKLPIDKVKGLSSETIKKLKERKDYPVAFARDLQYPINSSANNLKHAGFNKNEIEEIFALIKEMGFTPFDKNN